VESHQLVSGRVAALRTNLSSPIDVRTPASFDEHRRLLRWFERGDLTAFETLLTQHITNSGRTYAQALKVA
jgi:DNA-binding GntR family transcriptional regulator